MDAPRIAVVGHVEWVTFASGTHPSVGEIALLREPFDRAAGGGAVTAVELARLGADVRFLTALGNDEAARSTRAFLADRGVDVRAAVRPVPQTRVLTVLDEDGERTIMVIGENLFPSVADDLAWGELADLDAVYFTGGEPASLVASRKAPLLVVSGRRLAVLASSGVEADVLIGSANDPGEQLALFALQRPPRTNVATAGAAGGSWTCSDGSSGTWHATAPAGAPRDAYGAGDCFLAGVTFALAGRQSFDDAIALGARCGAAATTRRGPYDE